MIAPQAFEIAAADPAAEASLAPAFAAAGDFTPQLAPIVFVDIAVLTMLVFVAVAMLRSRHLFAVVMLSGIYSLLSAAFFVSLDAVDVAFTEAAVGAGVSTVLMLGAMLLTARREKLTVARRAPVARLAVFVTGAALIYATVDMPAFGDPNSPANAHVGRAYIERTPNDIELPNIVTAVLASYRGFDTLGEVLVVFTAGLSVILLLGVGSARGGRRVFDADEKDDAAQSGSG